MAPHPIYAVTILPILLRRLYCDTSTSKAVEKKKGVLIVLDNVRMKRRFVRQWLGNYAYVKSQILQLKNEYDEFIRAVYEPLRAADYRKNITKEKEATDVTADSVFLAEKSCIDYLNLLTDRIEELKAERETIERIAAAITDPNERKIIQLIYISGASWNDLKIQMNYESAQLRRIEARAVDRIYPMIITVMGGDDE